MSSRRILSNYQWLLNSSSRWFSKNISILLFGYTIMQIVTAEIEPKLNYDDSTASANTKFDKNDVNSISVSNTLNTDSTKSSLPISDLGFIHAFIASISVILVSELGDKTFFIAAIMAMRHPRLTVFSGAMSALALMTILSAVFGMAATIIPRIYTYYISTALFAIFGLKMLKDGYYMSATDAQEELEEVQSDLRKREDELLKSMKDEDNLGNGSNHSLRIHRGCNVVVNDDDDDDDRNDDQTRSMLSSQSSTVVVVGSSSSSTGGIIGQDTTRRTTTQTNLANLNNHLNLIDGSPSALNSNSTGTTIVTNNDINANGMELIQIGNKKRLEREVSGTVVQDPESGVLRKNTRRSAAYLTSRIFMQAFTMTFLAEWGDRSQLTTIILSAREDVYGVIVGGVLGHSMCTGLAVIGGRMIAQKISVRTVTLVGGVVFLLFAISALFFNPNDE